MADTIIDRLFIAFGVKTEDVEKGMSKAESIITGGLESIQETLMPFVTGFALAGMVTSFTQGANAISKASNMLGMSMEDLQAWQGAAEAMGAEGEEVNAMLADMNEYLVDMVQFGSGPAVDILNKLGISATDAAGNIRSATDVLLDMAAAGEKISRQEMLAYGKIMGFDESVIDLLMQGRKGLEDLLKAQKELAVFSKEDAEIAKQGKIAWNGMTKSLQAVQAVIMRVVLPVLIVLTGWLTKAVVWAKQNQPFMIALVMGFALAIIGILIPAIVKLAASGWAAMAPWLPLIALIMLVALAVDDLWTYLEGGESALEPVWRFFERFFAFFGTSIEGAKQLWQSACEFMAAVFSGNWEQAGQSVVNMFSGFIQMIIGLFEGLGAYILDLINNITGGAVDAFKSKISSMFDWAADAWGSAKDFFGFGDDEEEQKSFGGWKDFENVSFPMAVSQEDVVKATVPQQAKGQTNNITSTANVGNITINTQATDAQGIAKSIGPAMNREFSGSSLVMASNTGVIAK